MLWVLVFGIGPANAQEATICSGVDVMPGDDLVAVAAAHDPGTTYCIHDGSYSVTEPVVVQSSDSFIGVYSDGIRPKVQTGVAEHVFYFPMGEHDALISGLDISGAIGDSYCKPNCGRGIGGGGRNLTVEDTHIHDNQNQGIGGAGPGLIVRDSELDHNGSLEFTANATGASSAAGVKSVNSMTITNSYIHDNFWDGIWCDNHHSTPTKTYLYARNNVVKHNGKIGISNELCTTARISGNRVIDNGWYTLAVTVRTGILISGSPDAKVYDNKVTGNRKYGILLVASTYRGATLRAYVHDNRVWQNKINLHGCNISGVICKRNGS